MYVGVESFADIRLYGCRAVSDGAATRKRRIFRKDSFWQTSGFGFLDYRQSRLEMVEFLLAKGVKVDVASGDTYGTVLHAAARSGGPQMGKLLLENDEIISAIDAVDCIGLTALHCALSISDSLEVVKMLLRKGADISLPKDDRNGNHVLRVAQLSAMTKLLLANGADVFAINSIGKSAIFPSIGYDDEDATINILINHPNGLNVKGSVQRFLSGRPCAVTRCSKAREISRVYIFFYGISLTHALKSETRPTKSPGWMIIRGT
jgi:ankyrin repeat protein